MSLYCSLVTFLQVRVSGYHIHIVNKWCGSIILPRYLLLTLHGIKWLVCPSVVVVVSIIMHTEIVISGVVDMAVDNKYNYASKAWEMVKNCVLLLLSVM